MERQQLIADFSKDVLIVVHISQFLVASYIYLISWGIKVFYYQVLSLHPQIDRTECSIQVLNMIEIFTISRSF